MSEDSLPSITIITCSYQSDLKVFRKMLKGISSQDYPKKKIEHIVMEGGSTNGSLELLKNFNTKVYVEEKLKSFPLKRMQKAILIAKGEILLFLEPDNIPVGKKWLKEMVKPFIDNKKIVSSFSMWNAYERSMPMLTKYFALLGVNDPVVYYLKKSEKLPVWKKNYDIGKVIKKMDRYTIVKFSRYDLPTLGDNGHMVRRKVILKVVRKNKHFLHTDAFAELLNDGFDTFAAVHNSVIHYTGGSLLSHFRRRVKYKSQYYDNNLKNRTYLVFDPYSKKDRLHLMLFIFYTLTLVEPIIFSIRGFLSRKEPAWFIHPIACILAVVYYAKAQFWAKEK
jgi:hypothetical protein